LSTSHPEEFRVGGVLVGGKDDSAIAREQDQQRGASAMFDDRVEWEKCEEREGERKGHGLKCLY
jgi:hypothetical protein